VTLRFGVFEGFKGATTLLIWGDDEGIAHLRAVFGEFANGRRHAASLQEMPWATAIDGTRLNLRVARNGDDKMSVALAGTHIDWKCSSEHFAESADKVAALLSPACESGHQYLDTRGEALQVMVSKGEYAPDGTLHCHRPA
jgi:hypothetical protein